MAEKYLRKKGFSVLERNYKNKYGEIDIIAQSGDVLVFVEVRSSSTQNFGSPEETVDHKKMEKMKKNALALTTLWKWEGACRLDLVCVFLYKNGELKKVEHYEDITN